MTFLRNRNNDSNCSLVPPGGGIGLHNSGEGFPGWVPSTHLGGSSVPPAPPLLSPVPLQNYRLLWILPLPQVKPHCDKPNVTPHTRTGGQKQLPHSFAPGVLELRTLALTHMTNAECPHPNSSFHQGLTSVNIFLFLPLELAFCLLDKQRCLSRARKYS